LLAAGDDDQDFTIKDPRAPGGKREQTWHYPSRTECLTCHSRQAGFALGWNTWQMNREQDYGGVLANQLATFVHIGALKAIKPGEFTTRLSRLPRLANPHDSTADLTNRVRAYLHANCSHCHTEAGGGNSAMELEFTKTLAEMRIVNVKPIHDTFGIKDAKLVAPGHPERSVLLHRISHRDKGHMPPLATRVVDQVMVDAIREWILGMGEKAKK